MSRRFRQAARAGVATSLVFIGLGAAAACQTVKDDSFGQTSQPATTPADWNQQYDVPHYDVGPIPPFFRFDSISDPWPSVSIATCQSYTTPETPPNSQPTRDCWCTNCMDWVHQCDALQGCREEVLCAAQTGCTDQNSCYLFPQPTAKDPTGKACVDVINRWGTIALPTYLFKKLADCGNAAACPLPP